jgi:hypothetical protein
MASPVTYTHAVLWREQRTEWYPIPNDAVIVSTFGSEKCSREKVPYEGTIFTPEKVPYSLGKRYHIKLPKAQ